MKLKTTGTIIWTEATNLEIAWEDGVKSPSQKFVSDAMYKLKVHVHNLHDYESGVGDLFVATLKSNIKKSEDKDAFISLIVTEDGLYNGEIEVCGWEEDNGGCFEDSE